MDEEAISDPQHELGRHDPGRRDLGRRGPGRPIDQAARQARRRRILDAAAHCFVRDGFAGASVADICREAGISPGSLYQSFRNKEDLVLAMVEDDHKIALETFGRWLAAEDFCGRMIEDLAAFFGEPDEKQVNYGRLVMEFLAESGRTAVIRAAFARFEDEMVDALSLAIRKAQLVGRVDAAIDASAAATAILALFDGLLGRLVIADAAMCRRLAAAASLAVSRLLRPDGPADAAVQSVMSKTSTSAP